MPTRNYGRRASDMPASQPPLKVDLDLKQITRLAFELLHPDPDAARYAWLDGMALIEGALVFVAEAVLGNGLDMPFEPGVLITTEAGFVLDAEHSAEARRRLMHSASLLTMHGAALGCSADGALVLHRTVAARRLTGAGLAAEILATRRLQQLLEGGWASAQHAY